MVIVYIFCFYESEGLKYRMLYTLRKGTVFERKYIIINICRYVGYGFHFDIFIWNSGYTYCRVWYVLYWVHVLFLIWINVDGLTDKAFEKMTTASYITASK